MAYTPTEWHTGDKVTAGKLNKLENAVAELSESSGGGGGKAISDYAIELHGSFLTGNGGSGTIWIVDWNGETVTFEEFEASIVAVGNQFVNFAFIVGEYEAIYSTFTPVFYAPDFQALMFSDNFFFYDEGNNKPYAITFNGSTEGTSMTIFAHRYDLSTGQSAGGCEYNYGD